MTTIFEKVSAALSTLSPAIPFRGEIFLTESADSLPDVFITYSLISAPRALSADNAERERLYRVQVTINVRAGLNALPSVPAAMAAAGFERANDRQLPFDNVSRHFRVAQDYTYLENQT